MVNYEEFCGIWGKRAKPIIFRIAKEERITKHIPETANEKTLFELFCFVKNNIRSYSITPESMVINAFGKTRPLPIFANNKYAFTELMAKTILCKLNAIGHNSGELLNYFDKSFYKWHERLLIKSEEMLYWLWLCLKCASARKILNLMTK